MYINDIKNEIRNCKFVLFIDDLKIYLEYSDSSELELMQQDLKRIEDWGKNNNLKFNVKKCCTINYTKAINPVINNFILYSEVLANSRSIKDLGILFHHNMNFEKHIEGIILKCTKKVNYLKFKYKQKKNLPILTNLYNSLVKSSLMYGSIIWSPNNKSTIYNLEKVQIST